MKLWARVSIGAILILTAIVIGPGTAQHTQPAPKMINQIYPGPLGTANFGKIISGRYTDDLKLDCAVFDASRLVLVSSPATFDNAITVAEPVNDAATLSGGSSFDSILTVGPDGLVRHRRTATGGAWETPVVIRDASTAFANSVLVASGNLDGMHGPDIVTVDADRHTARILYSNASGTYDTGPAFTVYGNGVNELHLLNFRDGSGYVTGGLEMAFLDQGGAEVWTSSTATPSYVKGLAWPYSLLRGAVIRDTPTGFDRLALTTRYQNLDRLGTFGDAATELGISIGNVGVVSISSGDANHDGDVDVFLGINTANHIIQFTNRYPTTPTFHNSAKAYFAFGPSGRNPANFNAGISAGDWDSDGYMDVLSPVQGGPYGPPDPVFGYLALINVESDPAPRMPVIEEVTYTNNEDPVQDTIELKFLRPATPLEVPGATTAIAVRVYYTQNLNVGTTPLPYREHCMGLPPPVEGAYGTYTFDLPLGFDLATSNSHFSVLARQVAYQNGTSTMVAVGAGMTGVFTAEPHWALWVNDPRTKYLPLMNRVPITPTELGGLDVGPTVPSLEEEIEPVDDDKLPPPGD